VPITVLPNDWNAPPGSAWAGLPLNRLTVVVPAGFTTTTASNSTPGAAAPKRAVPAPRLTPNT
jgi:hypothetical protein